MKRDLLIVGLVVATGAIAAAGIVVRDYLQRQREMSERLAAIHAPPAPVAITPTPAPIIEPPAPKVAPAPQHPPIPPVPVEPKPTVAVAPPQPPRRMQTSVVPNAPITKEVARDALSYVGADPEAEAVWMQAINDPDRPRGERKDLIEDLNEHGFADPRNLTPDDLPLIQARIALIERVSDNAMDDTNAAAFQEAYKDLVVNMRARLTGG